MGPFSFIGGAIVGFIFNALLRRFQNERERWTARVDDFCEVLIEASDMAVEYWIEVGANKKTTLIDAKREIRIIGYQQRLDGLKDTFVEKLHPDDRAKLEQTLISFRDAMTGGDFQTTEAKIDKDRARDVQMLSSELFVTVRQAADRAMQRWPLAKWHSFQAP